VKAGADVNARQPDGAAALHWATHWNDIETVSFLLGAGADVNAANDFNVTPLSLACTNASAPMVERLLAAGANPNLAQANGETPLMTAARSGNAAIIRGLVARGAQVNAKEPAREQTALMWAAANHRSEVVRALVETGADVHARSTIVPRAYQTGSRYVAYDDVKFVVKVDDGGFTPLLFAARSGDAASAALLLAGGARIDDAAPSGITPLVVAVHSGNAAVATLLLEKGADPNAAGAGYTPLHAAILRGDVAVVRALVARGANVNAALERGTPVRRYSQDFAFSADLIGATPFWLAARFLEPEIMRLLIGADADTSLVMKNGATPVIAAVQARRRVEPGFTADPIRDEQLMVDAVTVAIEQGVDVDAANGEGNTAMHTAASRGLNRVIELLASRGASVDAKNKKGQTPLALAATGPGSRGPSAGRGANVTAELLRKLGAKE
jgi:ankyrin repeat protein